MLFSAGAAVPFENALAAELARGCPIDDLILLARLMSHWPGLCPLGRASTPLSTPCPSPPPRSLPARPTIDHWWLNSNTTFRLHAHTHRVHVASEPNMSELPPDDGAAICTLIARQTAYINEAMRRRALDARGDELVITATARDRLGR